VEVGVLDKEDVKAILAHELGHIVHRDNTYAIAASMVPYMTYVVGFGAFLVGVTWIKLAFEEGDNPLPGIALTIFEGALLLLSFLVNVGVLGFLRMREHLADLFSVKVARVQKSPRRLSRWRRRWRRWAWSRQVGRKEDVVHTPHGLRLRELPLLDHAAV